VRRALFGVLALAIALLTMAWSVRSTTGMVAWVFGDVIAERGNDSTVATALGVQIKSDQARIKELDHQRHLTRREERDREALRKQVAGMIASLQDQKVVGAADPGGKVFADIFGVDEKTITAWTFLLLIAVVESISSLGFSLLALAAQAANKSTQVYVNVNQNDSPQVRKISWKSFWPKPFRFSKPLIFQRSVSGLSQVDLEKVNSWKQNQSKAEAPGKAIALFQPKEVLFTPSMAGVNETDSAVAQVLLFVSSYEVAGTTQKTLWGAYKSWCEGERTKPMHHRAFYAALRRGGIRVVDGWPAVLH
jgi:hypothetical protein